MARLRRRTAIGVGAVAGGLLVAVLLVAWLGGGSGSSSRDSTILPGVAEGSGGAGSSTGSGSAAVAPVPAAPDRAAPDQAKSGGAAQLPAEVQPAGRSVVRSAQLRVDVTDVSGAAGSVRAAAAATGGIVADERTADGTSSLTLRVPGDKLDGVLDTLAKLGEVRSRAQQAQDVTDQVVDQESRLATQRASVARVRALLERANTVGEIVEIESELTRREADLESMEQRLAALNGQVAMSTVHVDLTSSGSPAAAGSESGFLAGLAAGWGAFGTAAAATLAALGLILPFAVLIAVLVAGVLAARRLIRRRRGALAEAK